MTDKTGFEWDPEKDRENQKKHSVSFPFAQNASVLDIGEKGRKYMKKKIKYTYEPMNHVRVVKDFLPPPEKLVLKEDTVKVTISLSKSSVEYFKKLAGDHGTQYQRVIRRLLDEYVIKFQ